MATKKRKAAGGTAVGLWFTKNFNEGDSSAPRSRKRKFIEEFYRGYLHAYNDAHPGQQKFKIDHFEWSITRDDKERTTHQVAVYITPPPLLPPPGGATSTDPPTPTKPPPEMA